MLIILLTFIIIRPFISSLAFPYENYIYYTLLLSFLCIWILNRGISIKKVKPIQYPLALFSLALFISLVFSSNIGMSIKELYKYYTGILFFLISCSLLKNEMDKVILSIVIPAFIISFLAIYQYFFGFQHLLKYITEQRINYPFALNYISRRRPFYPFVTPNTLAGYLAMIIPLVLIYKKRIWLILPCLFALLLTKSLGVFLSISLGLAIYFHLKRNLIKKSTIIFLVGLLIITAFVFIVRGKTQKQNFPIFSIEMRLNYWRETLRLIKMHPLVGVGLGNFNLVYSRYAHNSYLQIWAEMGILGIVSFLWLVAAVIKSGLKVLKASSHKTYLAALITATLVFLIHNAVDFTFFLPEVSLIWWVVLGVLTAYGESG